MVPILLNVIVGQEMDAIDIRCNRRRKKLSRVCIDGHGNVGGFQHLGSFAKQLDIVSDFGGLVGLFPIPIHTIQFFAGTMLKKKKKKIQDIIYASASKWTPKS
jgi:hypothetical protein